MPALEGSAGVVDMPGLHDTVIASPALTLDRLVTALPSTFSVTVSSAPVDVLPAVLLPMERLRTVICCPLASVEERAAVEAARKDPGGLDPLTGYGGYPPGPEGEQQHDQCGEHDARDGEGHPLRPRATTGTVGTRIAHLVLILIPLLEVERT